MNLTHPKVLFRNFDQQCSPLILTNCTMDSPDETILMREPAVAGQFYPGSPNGLKAELQRLFAKPERQEPQKKTLAVISPHAGYVYSGSVAAMAFMQVDPDKQYDNIFVIGSSHRYTFDGAAVFTRGHYKTPLGIVPVNLKLSHELMTVNSLFTDRSDVQNYEHSLEVQLPFLQYRLKKPFQIVPIVIATQSASTCRNIAHALQSYLTPDNLFVISTDFSHYPDYENACRVDRMTAESIVANDPDILLKSLDKNVHAGVPGLSTCLCGWTSVLTLLYMTEKNQGIRYRIIKYKNSGDAVGIENKSRVVGYYAITIEQTENVKPVSGVRTDQFLDAEDKSTMLSLARNAISSKLIPGQQSVSENLTLSHALMQKAGLFISLYKQGKLRGCIGRFTPDLPLHKLIQEIAVASALRDHRFHPVTASEIPELKIEISVLTPLVKIESIDEIELGRHGIYIKSGSQTGTYLPQVALNTGWTKLEFLEHCSADKAGIGRNGWKEAEIFIYEALIIKEEEM